MAGALGIEPRSSVLETDILAAVLCPFTIDYCTIKGAICFGLLGLHV